MFVYFTSYNSASQINRKQAIQENAVTCNDELGYSNVKSVSINWNIHIQTRWTYLKCVTQY
jgi:hypothetical protein